MEPYFLWVARDYDGRLTAFTIKPIKGDGPFGKEWLFNVSDAGAAGGSCVDLPVELFPNLTWEDEPIKVYLSLYSTMG